MISSSWLLLCSFLVRLAWRPPVTPRRSQWSAGDTAWGGGGEMKTQGRHPWLWCISVGSTAPGLLRGEPGKRLSSLPFTRRFSWSWEGHTVTSLKTPKTSGIQLSSAQGHWALDSACLMHKMQLLCNQTECHSQPWWTCLVSLGQSNVDSRCFRLANTVNKAIWPTIPCCLHRTLTLLSWSLPAAGESNARTLVKSWISSRGRAALCSCSTLPEEQTRVVYCFSGEESDRRPLAGLPLGPRVPWVRRATSFTMAVNQHSRHFTLEDDVHGAVTACCLHSDSSVCVRASPWAHIRTGGVGSGSVTESPGWFVRPGESGPALQPSDQLACIPFNVIIYTKTRRAPLWKMQDCTSRSLVWKSTYGTL